MAAALRPLGGEEWLLSMQEWDEYPRERDPEVDVLEDDPATRLQIAALARHGGIDLRLERRGFRVTTSSFVGRVKVGPLTIVIAPKIEHAPMIALLRYAFGLHGMTTFDHTSHGTSTLGFEDLLALELGAEVSGLLRRGLSRRYVPRNEELSSPCGRIEFERLARGDRSSASLPCRHHLRLTDNALNRALLMGLSLARSVCSTGEVRARLHRLREGFDGVTEPRVGPEALKQAARQVDRTTVSYQPALDLIEAMMDGTGVALEQDRPIRLRGFLFDMNMFFQRLLEQFFRHHLAGGTVIAERPLRGMLRWDPQHNPGMRRDPKPRPDLAIRCRGGKVELLDAKYQRLGSRPPSADVMYQLAIYALSRDADGHATILFPGSRVDPMQVLNVSTATKDEQQARVILCAVDLEYLHQLLASPGATRERAAYARHLVFGTGPSLTDPAVS